MTAVQRKKYLNVESKMKALLIKSVKSKIGKQLVGFERFTDQWSMLDEIINGEKGTRLMILNQKLQSVKWTKSLKKTLDYFLGLVQEYRSLDGNLTDTEITQYLFNVLPKDSIKQNKC